MPEINSVAGQLVGIPVGQVYTAGTGIKIDNVNKVVSVDETVLWSGSTAVSVGGEYNLSESCLNFERIRIEAARSAGSGNNPIVREYAVTSDSNANNNITFVGAMYSASTTGGTLYVDCFGAVLYRNKLTIGGFARKELRNNELVTSSSAPITITKIVGIIRKSA